MDYRYYEKPTTTNTTIKMATAMGENPKVQCLANDLVRRLLNTREELPNEERRKVIDGYGIKLLTSGYRRAQVRRILVSGMKGYLTKRSRRKAMGRRIHLTAEESAKARIRKKLLAKSSWYKARSKIGRAHV